MKDIPMTLMELQSIANTITAQHDFPHIPITINRRFRRTLGRRYHYYCSSQSDRIELASRIFAYPQEVQLSVLLHEISHALTNQGHTPYFYSTLDTLQKQYHIYEKRTPKGTKHGWIGDIYLVNPNNTHTLIRSWEGNKIQFEQLKTSPNTNSLKADYEKNL